MKVQKRFLGRERPALYKGEFTIPDAIVNRLVTSRTHHVLSTITSFATAVDQLYLAIDNALSAFVTANEGTLTTRDHREKIRRYLNHLRNPKRYGIEKGDFERFYDIWSKSRYNGYIPTWTELYEMRAFTTDLISITVTETARHYKSDETILDDRVRKAVRVYPSERINDHIGEMHERAQIMAEEQGKILSNRVGMKLANPWNFIDVSLFTDKEELSKAIDKSDQIQDLLREITQKIEELFVHIQLLNHEVIVSAIADAKQRKGKQQGAAFGEALEASFNHPELSKFRIAFNAIYDSSEPRDTIDMLGGIMFAALNDAGPIGKPNRKIRLSRWQLIKKHRALKNKKRI